MKENKNIEELFREKLQNYEQVPPAYILENILAASSVNSRKRKIIFWRVAGVAAALLLAFVAGWQFNAQNGQDVKQVTVTSHDTANKPGHENVSTSETSMLAASGNSNQNQNISRPEMSGRTNIKETEPNYLASNNNEVFKPIKSRSAVIQTGTESAVQLRTRKTNEVTSKTIDQQIMEQNQQMVMAQLSEKEKGRWLVGAQVSPVHNVSNGSQSKQYASNMLNSESDNPVDLGVGLTVEYKPGKRWSVQSGVYYSGMEQTSGNSTYQGSKSSLAADHGAEYLNTKVNVDAKTNKISMNSSVGVIEFSGVPSQVVIGNNIEGSSLASAVFVSDAQFTQSFEYVEIPLYVRYVVLDTRFDIEMLGGFSSNLLVSNQTYMQNSLGESLIGKTKDMETLNYSSTMGVGFKYELSKRFFLNLEPRVKYFLNSLNSNESVTYKPYSIGVFTGISYQF